jgi:hypothetical protein
LAAQAAFPKTATPTAKNIVCKICVAAPLLLASVEPKPAFWPTNPHRLRMQSLPRKLLGATMGKLVNALTRSC